MLKSRYRLHAVVIVGVMIPFCIYALWFSPGAVQRQNMTRAEEFIPRVRATINEDQRFNHVEMSPYTAGEGELLIGGFVRKGDLTELKRRVSALSPPVAVAWGVRELDDDAFASVVASATQP